ncbi:hypothetical protein DID88_006191 [Monilinia fructigena]|uniref:Uncharacterized protein n=1 Tax=Monilinia fructigena TaxID=38457 RepID=A0A395J2C8_9HELO|nr:hypothetical protein DID88_006191 [Monilinia fructigena]
MAVVNKLATTATMENQPSKGIPNDGTGVVQLDPWLEPFKDSLKHRFSKAQGWIKTIDDAEGGLEKFSRGTEKFGFNVDKKNNITYREWAPNATQAFLIGEFNDWNRESHPMKKDPFGVFEIVVPAKNGKPAIAHNSKVKISLITPSGERIERIPAWIKYVTQDLSVSPVYDARFWNPPQSERYVFKNPRPKKPESVRVYEAHVGISSPELRVSTYKESTVFFAASSRYGTPDDLKELIDTAHGLGITVLLDVVHSHASKNVLDGLNEFDGTDSCYFHDGPKGKHELWDSRLFNYGSHEVLRFLLTCFIPIMELERDFLEVTMSTLARVLMKTCVVYLMIANEMLHQLFPEAITIAEDVSGMPALCLPLALGGVGFDYRLAMAIPDMWIKILKEKKDDEWDLGNICFTLTNRRHGEKTIAYCESHDQALVGDKSIMMHLCDAEMYTNMSKLTQFTPIIERGMALHKMIRLLTHGLGGEGYLNFEGNEFGHPEWLDFPREGNSNSFWYARRQFNLPDDELLRYRELNEFDAHMQHLEAKYGWLHSDQAYISLKNESDKVIVFERAGLLWIFNFHPTQSFVDYRVGIEQEGTYRVVLNTDTKDVGGFERIDAGTRFFTTPFAWNGRKNFIQVYIPTRTAMVLALESTL